MLPPGIRAAIKKCLRPQRPAPPVQDYTVITPESAPTGFGGWRAAQTAQAQHAAFAPLLAELRAGRPRADFAALGRAFALLQLDNPHIVEIGCGHGWNNEVLTNLWQRPFRYTGLDISGPMLALGRRDYPAARFAVADAHRLPIADAACDVALSGTVLMHLADYPRAIAECVRIARAWCVFHTVPVVTRRPTVFMTKPAYGGDTIEVLINETELLALFARHGLKLVHTLESLEYDLHALVGEPTPTRTYLCRKS